MPERRGIGITLTLMAAIAAFFVCEAAYQTLGREFALWFAAFAGSLGGGALILYPFMMFLHKHDI